MTDRWRLCNGRELFDIDLDPGQKNDVADEHPEVVQRLRDFYEAWWAELEPTFDQSTAIYLGHPADNPARLTSHDWITTKMTPWNQSQVRAAMNGPENTGFWNVKVTEPGRYQVRLRRWPLEIDRPIESSLPQGAPVPGAKAFRETPGKAIAARKATLRIGDQQKSLSVPKGANEVLFELDLVPQTTTMAARFETESGEVFGAYFAYVEKLD
jgi:arylsulfatase B